MNIKLLIADVDGTMVTNSKQLTARTRESVARLRESGVLFSVTSGRPPRGLASVVEALGLTTPVAAFNGGVYVKSDLTTVMAQHTLSAPVAAEAVRYLLDAGLDVWVYRGSDWFLRDDGSPHVARESRNVGFGPIVVSDLDPTLDGALKIVGVSDDLSLVARCEDELGGRIASDATILRSRPSYLDITHPHANKGMVVHEAARLLHLRLDEIATIGDMLNDVPMLRVAGMGIAMGNASAEVQRIARHVTRSNEDDGFAHAVDTYILGQPPVSQTGLGLPPRTRACLFGLEGVLVQSARVRGREPVETHEGSIRYVRAARAAGLRTLVIASPAGADRILTSARIADLFDARVDTVLEAARRVGVEVQDTTFFGGELAAVGAARAAHAGYIVGVDRLGQSAQLFQHGADAVVPDLAALLQPSAVIYEEARIPM